MSTSKLFTVAGTSTHNGATKVRWANDYVSRIKNLSRGGGEVNLVELPHAMTKLEALQFIQQHESFQSAHEQAVISEQLSDRVKVAKKGEVKISAKAVKVAVPEQTVPDAV